MEKLKVSLGKKIEEAIKSSGLSIEAVAGHADISVATLRRLFKKDSIDTEILKKISEVTKQPLEDFFQIIIYAESGTGKSTFFTKQPNELELAKIKHELEICRLERDSLIKELQLKDEIIALLKKG